MAESRLVGVPAEDVHRVWPFVAPLLLKAVDRCGGLFDLDDVRGWLDDRSWQLWVSLNGDEIEAAACTQIVRWPKKLVCAMPLLGGKGLRNWREFEPMIAVWAREQGCDEMEGYAARRGWLRVLADWRECHTVMRREL